MLAEGFGIGLVPFIAHQQHGLRDVDGREGGVDGGGDDHIGQRHLIIAEAPALAAKQKCDTLTPRDAGAHVMTRLLWRDHFLDHVAWPRRGGIDVVHVFQGCGHIFINLGAVENPIGAGGCVCGPFVGPAISWCHEAQLVQTKVGHRACGCTNVLAKLRMRQHDERCGAEDLILCFVSACHFTGGIAGSAKMGKGLLISFKYALYCPYGHARCPHYD